MKNKDKKRISFPIKNRTRVDFIRTEVLLGEKDGEVVVKTTAKIQLDKLEIANLSDLWVKYFPGVSRNGVFTTVARATCGNEPFDFEKGKNIAETRAQKKAYNVASRIFTLIEEELEKQLKWIKFFRINCDNSEKHAAEHIIELDK